MKRTFVGLAALAVLSLPFSFAHAQESKQGAAKAAKKGGLSKQDVGYLRRMGEADLAEVESGKLAQSKASSGEVKQFGQHMIEDHGKGMKEGESLAKSKGQQPPAAPSKKHQAAMKKLESLSGNEFDRAYMRQMVQDHQDTLKLLQDAAKNAKDPEIKAAAEKKVPVVQKHLEMAKTTVASIGGADKSARGGSSDKKAGR